MKAKIAVLAGDGVGREIVPEAVKVLNVIGETEDVSFVFDEALLGGAAIDATGSALPDETVAKAHAADAVLLAAIGGPKWDNRQLILASWCDGTRNLEDAVRLTAQEMGEKKPLTLTWALAWVDGLIRSGKLVDVAKR